MDRRHPVGRTQRRLQSSRFLRSIYVCGAPETLDVELLGEAPNEEQNVRTRVPRTVWNCGGTNRPNTSLRRPSAHGSVHFEPLQTQRSKEGIEVHAKSLVLWLFETTDRGGSTGKDGDNDPRKIKECKSIFGTDSRSKLGIRTSIEFIV